MAHAPHREDCQPAEQLMQPNEPVIEVVLARAEDAGHEAVGCKAGSHLSRYLKVYLPAFGKIDVEIIAYIFIRASQYLKHIS